MRPPTRGEVWIVDLGLAAKVRPAVVLSVPPSETERALVTLVPHTTSVRNSRFEVATKTAFLKPGAFDAQALVTVPFPRLVRPLGQLKPHELACPLYEVAVQRDHRFIGYAALPAGCQVVLGPTRPLISLHGEPRRFVPGSLLAKLPIQS